MNVNAVKLFMVSMKKISPWRGSLPMRFLRESTLKSISTSNASRKRRFVDISSSKSAKSKYSFFIQHAANLHQFGFISPDLVAASLIKIRLVTLLHFRLNTPDVLADTIFTSHQVFDRHCSKLPKVGELSEDGMVSEDSTVLLVVVEFFPSAAVVDVGLHDLPSHISALFRSRRLEELRP